MCMELLNDVVIQCEECGNIIVIKKEYLDAETSSYERQMGPEIVYDIYCMSAGKKRGICLVHSFLRAAYEI